MFLVHFFQLKYCVLLRILRKKEVCTAKKMRKKADRHIKEKQNAFLQAAQAKQMRQSQTKIVGLAAEQSKQSTELPVWREVCWRKDRCMSERPSDFRTKVHLEKPCQLEKEDVLMRIVWTFR